MSLHRHQPPWRQCIVAKDFACDTRTKEPLGHGFFYADVNLGFKADKRPIALVKKWKLPQNWYRIGRQNGGEVPGPHTRY